MEFNKEIFHIAIWNNQKLGRFVEKLYFSEKGCIEWTGSLDTSGYGLFRYNKKLWKAHRFMVEKICNNIIPRGKIVLHSCDNPKCVNPLHLKIGTSKENARDRDSKGRSNLRTRYNSHGNAKVSPEKVALGMEMYHKGVSMKDITSFWGVHKTTAYRIVNKELRHDI